MLNFILLQADAGGGFNTQWIMIGAMVIIFYLFFIRPQQKKQKDQKNFINEVKKGDPIVTIGGIHGKIYSVDETTVTIELDKGFKMKIEKSSISQEATKRLTAAEK
ncbi:MAG: preprotein translocase subunit YajC [bacterium]|nr:preprotein translocase subunit YajC [bacterium]